MEENGVKVKNEEQDRRLAWLENHYSTFNTEMGDVKADVAVLKEQMTRCLWWGKLIAGTSVATVITGIINILMSK